MKIKQKLLKKNPKNWELSPLYNLFQEGLEQQNINMTSLCWSRVDFISQWGFELH